MLQTLRRIHFQRAARGLFLLLWSLCASSLLQAETTAPQSWIRINQLGYLPQSLKVAVVLSQQEQLPADFELCRADDHSVVWHAQATPASGKRWGMQQALRLDFSAWQEPGRYYLRCAGVSSPVFAINGNVYDGTADYLLRYMRQQRCGYNPCLDTVCHQHDGFIVDHPTRSGDTIDVRGGWHDASDYLQYLPTSATATYQMLFAWRQHPDTSIFHDRYDARGREGANGIPDLLDEARWGLEWLARMNPDSAEMYNQIADDRDHAGMRLPHRDPVDYGWGKGTGRPVYFITGRPQGPKYKNRTTGVASSAAKFASSFALGAEIFDSIDPTFAQSLRTKVSPAYSYAEALPGNTQTICVISPYFYEEGNYVDDLELAAATRYATSGNTQWLQRADYWGALEEVTPWMELGRGRHYQYYPFVNLGHYYLAQSDDPTIRARYCDFMRRGLESLRQRAVEQEDPFLFGLPFLWCSNNLVSAALTQARLYEEVSGDTTYRAMEASLRDWLFGCNPWGSSMICGLPETGDSPQRVHSAFQKFRHETTYGGLVDGPISRALYESRLGVHLNYEDPYALFQFGEAVYHDDPGDYSSNEPTMDGTAGLSYYLSTLEHLGQLQHRTADVQDALGATVRKDTTRKVIYLIFSADNRFEGAEPILRTLARRGVHGSFFLTGNGLRNPEFEPIIRRIVAEGHYLGGHSAGHLLYATWGDRQPLVTADSLLSDLRENYRALRQFGIAASQARYFLPPYEHYTADNVRWIESTGLQVVNLTPGIGTAADYTTPDMPNYRTSRELMDRLFAYEKEHGLSGAILLIHPGTEASRTDKLYLHLNTILKTLQHQGYTFERLP